jgi:hypothetical protein
MIPVTYEPLEGVLVFVAGPFLVDNYTLGDDYLGTSWGLNPTDGC